MNKLITLALLFVVSLSVSANDIVVRWEQLLSEYASAAEIGDFSAAYKTAMELVVVDPSSTDAKLYLVLACIQLGQEPPSWVLGEPWADATPSDRINRVAAEALLESFYKAK